MFQNPRAPYTTSNNFTNFTPNFYTRPYILSHVVPTFFTSVPPERRSSKNYSTDFEANPNRTPKPKRRERRRKIRENEEAQP
jgi:hypothetical protein